MNPQEIKQALKERKTSQKAIARRLQVSEMSVSKAIHRAIVSDRIFSAVARALGRHKTAVFPDYYLGPRKRSTSKAIGGRGHK